MVAVESAVERRSASTGGIRRLEDFGYVLEAPASFAATASSRGWLSFTLTGPADHRRGNLFSVERGRLAGGAS